MVAARLRYQWCWDFNGNMCEQIDQKLELLSCGC